MFRAADCANDTLANKVRTIDLRLTLGSSPAHADMLTWNPADTAEAAALQLVSTMFAVPQISVRPYLLPESHNVMMKSWLEFWKAHRSTLLFGKFHAENPELLYSQASAEDDGCYIAVSFANNIIISRIRSRRDGFRERFGMRWHHRGFPRGRIPRKGRKLYRRCPFGQHSQNYR